MAQEKTESIEFEVADKYRHPFEYMPLKKFLKDLGMRRGHLMVLQVEDSIDYAEYDDGMGMDKEEKKELRRQIYDALDELVHDDECRFYRDARMYEFRNRPARVKWR